MSIGNLIYYYWASAVFFSWRQFFGRDSAIDESIKNVIVTVAAVTSTTYLIKN